MRYTQLGIKNLDHRNHIVYEKTLDSQGKSHILDIRVNNMSNSEFDDLVNRIEQLIQPDGSASPSLLLLDEPEGHWVPFDFHLSEDRDAIRGQWIRNRKSSTEKEHLVLSVSESTVTIIGWELGAKTLFEDFEFIDGTPVGKWVED